MKSYEYFIEQPLYKSALHFATVAHEGQFRKNPNGARWQREPYIVHPIAVAKKVYHLIEADILGELIYTELMVLASMATALLHDTVEDTSVTLEDITKEFTISILDGVQKLTKIEGDTYLDAVLRAKESRVSTLVKAADNLDNMKDLTPGHLKDKYSLSFYILTRLNAYDFQ